MPFGKQLAAESRARAGSAVVFDENDPKCTRGRKASLEAFRSSMPKKNAGAPHTRDKPSDREANRLANTMKHGAGLEDFRSENHRGSSLSKSAVNDIVAKARSGGSEGSFRANARKARRKRSIFGRARRKSGASSAQPVRSRSASLPGSIPVNPLYAPGSSNYTTSNIQNASNRNGDDPGSCCSVVRNRERRKRISGRLGKDGFGVTARVLDAKRAFMSGLGSGEEADTMPPLPPLRPLHRNHTPDQSREAENEGEEEEIVSPRRGSSGTDVGNDARLQRINSMRDKIRTRGASTIEYSTYFDAVNWIKENVKATKTF